MLVLSLALEHLDPGQHWELDRLIALGAPAPAGGLGERGAVAILTPRLEGLPVDMPAHVTFRADGSVQRVVASPIPERRVGGEPLSWEEIHPLALRLGAGANARGRLAWQPGPGGTLRRVWTVEVDAWEGGVRRLLLDAGTGEVLDLERSEDPVDPSTPGGVQARVFVHNPALQQAPLDVRLLTAGALADERVLVMQCRDKGSLAQATLPDDTVLPLHVCTREAVRAEGRDWRANPVLWPSDPARDEDDFVAPHAYWNALRGLDWFEALGWVPREEVLDPRLHVVVNYRGTDLWDETTASDPLGRLLPYNNAYYTGAYEDSNGRWVPPQLVLGQGSVVDLGYDADVLHHELAHYIVHSSGGPWRTVMTERGPSRRASALNEGFADYFSSAIHGDPLLAEFVALGFERGVLRDLGGDRTCMESLTGESHYDGLIMAQPLWQLRASLPAEQRPILDQVLLDGLPQMGSSADFALATDVLVEGTRARLGDEVANDLVARFAERGLPACPPVRPLAPPEGDEEYSLGFTEIPPAWPSSVDGEIPGYLQLRIDIPEGGAQVRLDFQQSQWLGIDLWGNAVPHRLSAVGKSGELLTWTRTPIDDPEDDSPPEDWRSDGEVLGTSILLGTRPDPDDPQNLLYDERLEWEVEQPGPFVFQLTNDRNRAVTATRLVLALSPLDKKASIAPEGCGCASSRVGVGFWAGLLVLCRRARSRVQDRTPVLALGGQTFPVDPRAAVRAQ